ncbi:MAG: prolyl oligopeptidase family serine peptidase [Planctomycetaceae bacterium]
MHTVQAMMKTMWARARHVAMTRTSPRVRAVRLSLIQLLVYSLVLTASSRQLSAMDDETTLAPVPRTIQAETISPLDGEKQPLLYWAPPEAMNKATPLFVFLHSWSSDYLQDNEKWLRACVEHRWIWLHPNFRGVNDSPKACGSKYARQDILDAIDFISLKVKVDPTRVYLAGVSGGGHMSLLMAGHHPDRFSAVSAWVGPTDLAEWYRFHCKDGQPQKYAQMVAKSLGGKPGDSIEIDLDYRDRSPVFQLHRSGELPVSIWAGVEDGHSGSVPVSHSLRAFNAIALGHEAKSPPVSDVEIEQLVGQKKLDQPQPQGEIPGLSRDVLLHRRSKDSEVIIFDGGHESLPEAAFFWLSAKQRKTQGQQN